MISFIKMYRTGKSLEIWLPGAERMGVTVNAYRVPSVIKNVLDLNTGGGCTTL